jgi:hypothetical protein
MEHIKQRIKNGNELIFVHIPKCGGTYANFILNKLGIKSIGHHQYISKNVNQIVFATIREPIDRFESMLNFRLQGKCQHFPIKNACDNLSFSLDYLVENMSDSEIISFKPYNSIEYYSKNVDFFITIDQLIPMLEYFEFDTSQIEKIPKNVSIKNRGILSQKNRKRIQQLYIKDYEIYNYWKNLMFH